MSSPPITLGQYQIIREIARSNDIVYEAYDPLMDRRVALKELNLPSGITDAQKEDRIQRFDREAKAAGRLAHPNIMRVYQVANDGERHFMAMEYLDGHTLRNEIDTKGFLPIDRAAEIATAVLAGLGHAHANGVVHRDIKPDNIQLLSSGEIKITDFGIARLTFQPNLTMDGQVFGTPSYMSPEQVVGKEIDARSDLFSVGVLLYEMISGQKPFQGDSVVAITYSIMNKEPDQLSQVNHSLWQVISRALDKSPALRFSSAQEMSDALDASLHQSIVLDTPTPPPGQTIYGPAGAYPVPPPVLNPYGQAPYGQSPQVAAPPPIYPYNPYAQPTGGYAPPHSPGFPQPGYTPPVFYPPPPRQPLMKPETKHFIGKLFLTLLVMGTLFGVVIVGVATIGGLWAKSEAAREDVQLVAQIQGILSGNGDPKEKASKAEQLIARLRSPENKAQENRQLAVIYETIGQQAMEKGDYTTAEEGFRHSTDLDPGNARLVSDLAALYVKYAQSKQGLDQRISTYNEALKWWDQAIDAAATEDRDRYMEAAAQVCYFQALELFNAGQVTDADSAIRNGRGYAPQGSSVLRDLDALENQLMQSQR